MVQQNNIFAFRPLLLPTFPSCKNIFALLWGKEEEDLRESKNACLARFQLHSLGGIFHCKIGHNLIFFRAKILAANRSNRITHLALGEN